jgi:hypothetical protein
MAFILLLRGVPVGGGVYDINNNNSHTPHPESTRGTPLKRGILKPPQVEGVLEEKVLSKLLPNNYWIIQ